MLSTISKDMRDQLGATVVVVDMASRIFISAFIRPAIIRPSSALLRNPSWEKG